MMGLRTAQLKYSKKTIAVVSYKNESLTKELDGISEVINGK
jgi:hypothetical protein